MSTPTPYIPGGKLGPRVVGRIRKLYHGHGYNAREIKRGIADKECRRIVRDRLQKIANEIVARPQYRLSGSNEHLEVEYLHRVMTAEEFMASVRSDLSCGRNSVA